MPPGAGDDCMIRTCFCTAVLVAAGSPAFANLVITEVHSTGSSGEAYGADWFEVTNKGTTPVDITGWKMDDGSFNFSNAVNLRNLTSIPAGASVIFIESGSTGDNDETNRNNFIAAWFGSAVPAGLIVANYGGSGVGLSSGGDGVALYDASGNLQAQVSFGAATPGVTFDNSLGTDSILTTPLSVLSSVGVNGAFQSVADYSSASPGVKEVGSPGLIPEPTTLALLGLGALTLGRRRRDDGVSSF